MNVYNEVEVYENCTVQILRNSETGDYSVGWWKNDEKPVTIGGDNNE